MSHHCIIDEQVNIDLCPSLDAEYVAAAGAQITLGDLHGNAVKLLYALTRHGFVDITSEEYAAFVRIYRKHRLQLQDLKDVNTILERIKIKPEAQKSYLRLIGDVLADRGMNDYFTLKILKQLSDNNLSYEILISNHDAEFIKSVEKKLRFNISKLGGKQAQSSYKLQELIERKIIKREEVVELYETSFKPNLKALSYSLNDTQDKITIYSHGVIGLNNIEHISNALGTRYFGSGPVELARTIDKINEKFSQHTAQNIITELLSLDKIDIDALNGKLPLDEKKFPLAHLVWNRKVEGLIRPEHITFVHGHDISDKTLNNIINLDNDLGKDLYQHKGAYNALHSRDIFLNCVIFEEKKVVNDLLLVDEKMKPASLIARLSGCLMSEQNTVCTPGFDRYSTRPKMKEQAPHLKSQQSTAHSTIQLLK